MLEFELLELLLEEFELELFEEFEELLLELLFDELELELFEEFDELLLDEFEFEFEFEFELVLLRPGVWPVISGLHAVVVPMIAAAPSAAAAMRRRARWVGFIQSSCGLWYDNLTINAADEVMVGRA